MPPVTEYIETTETLMDFVITKLSADTSWTAVKFSGTDYKDLFEFIPELSLPAAVVVYTGSDYGNKPRRTARISVIVACQFTGDDDPVTIRALVDKAIGLLDKQILNQALFEVASDDPVEICSGIAAYVIDFEVKDY